MAFLECETLSPPEATTASAWPRPAILNTSAHNESLSNACLWFEGPQGARSAAVVIAHLLDHSETFAGVRNSIFNFDTFSTRLPEWTFAGSGAHHHVNHVYEPAEVAKERWFQVAHTTRAALSLVEMGEIFDGINDSLSAANWGIVDDALSEANPAQMSVDAIVVFARVPFMAKAHLRNWQSFLKRAKAELARRGESDTTLSGL